MPVFTGQEARNKRVRKPVETADTGRPETSKEFAARMKGRVRFLAPRKRGQEGAGTTGILLTTKSDKKSDFNMDYIENNVSAPDSVNSITELDSGLSDATLISVLSKTNDNFDLYSALKGRYKEDPLFKKILESPKDYHNFEVINDLIYLKQRETRVLCIPRIIINGRSIQEIITAEAHSLLAHLGASKTLDYLRDHVWWK
ncbi:hypothetical protein F5877DRAFT_55200, partial [Lentinula edodes]